MPSRVGYPDRGANRFPEHLLNIAHLLSDEDGALWVVFEFMPVVQKYTASGRLEWQVRLSGPPVTSMEATFWGDPGSSPAFDHESIEKVQLVPFIPGATTTSQHNLAVVLGNGVLVFLDRSGRQISTGEFELPQKRRPILSLGEYRGSLYCGYPHTFGSCRFPGGFDRWRPHPCRVLLSRAPGRPRASACGVARE